MAMFSKISRTKTVPGKKTGYLQDLVQNRTLYLMAVPAIVFLILFSYMPITGVVVAFKKFSFADGIYASPWIGLDNFREVFRSPYFLRSLRNSITISLMKLLIGFPFPIILALLLNEVRVSWFKRTVQTVTAIPYFISWVVMGNIMINLLSPTGGLVNELLVFFGHKPINFLVEASWFRPVLVITDLWKNMGWNAIIYMAALAGIDPQQYEAAMIDGAGRFKQLLHVTLPGIVGTITVVLILNVSWILSAGFEQVYLLYSPAVYDVGDIIETFSYRTGLSEGRFDSATAIGLFQSVVGCILMFSVNRIVKKTGNTGIF